MDGKPSLGERWADYRPSKTLFFWCCLVCIVATMVVGFSWGGWVTRGTAARMATDAAATAQAKLAAAYCVSQVEAAADAPAKLASLKKTDSWQRDDFVKQGGWVTLPGETEPVPGAADLCVQQLMNAKAPPVKAAVSG